MSKRRHHHHYSKRADDQANSSTIRSSLSRPSPVSEASISSVSTGTQSYDTDRNAASASESTSDPISRLSRTYELSRSAATGINASLTQAAVPSSTEAGSSALPLSLYMQQTTLAAQVSMIPAPTGFLAPTFSHDIPSSTTSLAYVALASPSDSVVSGDASATGGLSTTGKAVLGGVLGGLGTLGLVCALIFVVFTKGKKRKRPDSLEPFTPQRMVEKRGSRNAVQTPGVKRKTGLTLFSGRRRSGSVHRTPKKTETMSPSASGSFQVISGRRLSSPPSLHSRPGEATRQIGSTESSPRSGYTTPSRRSRLGGTPVIYRAQQDPVGRSQDLGSTLSHISRFVERLDDTT